MQNENVFIILHFQFNAYVLTLKFPAHLFYTNAVV